MNSLIRKYGILVILLLLNITGFSQVFDYVVDKNGSGDYTTIQEAIDAVSDDNDVRTLIFIKNGEYYEKVVVSSSKTNISLIGESADGVIITYDDNPSTESAADTYTLLAGASGLYMENLTVRNTSGNVGQAIAIRTTGDQMVFKNCRFLGFQDTYYAHKNRQYNYKCYIEGATDFIYGDATCVFDSCTINCVNGGRYITAPADTKLVTNFSGWKFLHGLLFRYCNITASDDVAVNSFYLGRPWQPDASSVYINCTLGNHIKPEGWSAWSGTNNHESSYFAEYQSKNPDGSFADTTNRVGWSCQLKEFAVVTYYKLSFFFRKNMEVWDPVPMTVELPNPDNIVVQGQNLSWTAVEGAIGYVISKNGNIIGFSALNSFSSPDVAEDASISIKSVSTNGNLGTGVGSIIVSASGINVKPDIGIIIKNNKISFSEKVGFELYSVSGRLIYKGNNDEVDVSGVNKGIYLIKAVNSKGVKKSQKITIF